MTQLHKMPQQIQKKGGENAPSGDLIDLLFEDGELEATFNAACQQAALEEESRLVTITIPFEQIDPLAALELLGRKQDFQYFWEHPDEKLSIAAGHQIARIRSNHRDRFNLVKKQIQDWKSRTFSFSTLTHSLAGLHFLGGFSFQDQPQEHHWKAFGTALFVIPEWLVIRDGELSLFTLTVEVTPGNVAARYLDPVRDRLKTIMEQVRGFSRNECPQSGRSNTDHGFYTVRSSDHAEKAWKQAITQAKQRIHRDEFKKIVLAREVQLTFTRTPEATQMLNYLRNEYPTCYTFMIRVNDELIFLGSTPEKLVALRASFILTDGLAGTISRGKTASEDTILERQLLASDKDRSEHGFVVEAIEKRLRTLTHNLYHPPKPGIRKYPNVQHLYTPITASLNDDVSPLDIVEKLHPTPAVGGFPRELTVQHIQSLEQFDRGWYAGPVGWINTSGRGEFCVAIRSGILLNNQARFFAGCGIVADSDPQSEWEETNLKLIPMMSALKHA